MAEQTIGYVLSDETKQNMEGALASLATAKTQGWEVTDVRIETRDEDGTQVHTGVIVIEKQA